MYKTQISPTICIVRASTLDNEKHPGIDILKWDAENLSHYNLKEDIAPYVDFVKVKNIHELFMLINIHLMPNDKYMVNIEDLYYTSDYVYQAIFKLPVMNGTYNELINDSNKLATQMLHEKHIVDGNMLIIKRSIVNNDFHYVNMEIDDVTDILRSQFLHDAIIVQPNNTCIVQQYIHDAFEINYRQSHLDNSRSHEFKFLDYRLFFHIDKNTSRENTNINKYASVIFGKKVYGNCLISLCDNDDASPTPLNINIDTFINIYWLLLHHRIEHIDIERKKYSRKLNIDNKKFNDEDICTEHFVHNNFPEITLCPNFFYIVKKEIQIIDIEKYKNIDETIINNIIEQMQNVLNDVD